MKNKKKGASSKTWVVDCMTDGAFDFALKVLYEAKNQKYPIELRINFVKIAYSNSLEAIARAQTDPKEYKLTSAFKLFSRNLKEISVIANKVYNDMICGENPYNYDIPPAETWSLHSRTVRENPFDFTEIHYGAIEQYIRSGQKTQSFVDKYHYPMIYEEVYSCKEANKAFVATLQPTNDILIHIASHIAKMFNISLNLNKQYNVPPIPKDELNEFEKYISDPNISSDIVPAPLLIHVPFDSFKNVTHLLSIAAANPNTVEEICITAYRLGKDNEMISDIILASKRGIRCKIYIELSARGEIDNDLEYLEKLITEGDRRYLNIKIRYNGIKVHGKMIYIGLKSAPNCKDRSIAVFSTGNYNPQTAKIYKDYHYITTERGVVDTIKRNFAVLWNSEQPILSSISNILSKEIYDEMGKGKDGKIWIQTNHLDNKQIVTFLREAIRRGCEVKLIVRTTKGFHKKEMKNCKTIVGKYLEHSRIYIFGDSTNRRVYLSSSDILFRNLYNRFESYIKISDPRIEKQLVDDFKELYKNGQKI